MARIEIDSEGHLAGYVVDIRKMSDDEVWLEVKTDWLHYANTNHGFAIMSVDDARKVIVELQRAIDEAAE